MDPASKLCRPTVIDWTHLVAGGLLDEATHMGGLPLRDGTYALAHMDYPGWVGYDTLIDPNTHRTVWYDKRQKPDRQVSWFAQTQDYPSKGV